MSETKPPERTAQLVQTYQLDAPPEKVWRALSIPAFREKWLPRDVMVEAEPIASAPGAEVSYRLRDDTPPFLESVVAFQIRPHADGTQLRIVHRLAEARSSGTPSAAANSNRSALMRAA